MEIRGSYDPLISTMGFPMLVRRHLYIESGPRASQNTTVHGLLIWAVLSACSREWPPESFLINHLCVNGRRKHFCDVLNCTENTSMIWTPFQNIPGVYLATSCDIGVVILARWWLTNAVISRRFMWVIVATHKVELIATWVGGLFSWVVATFTL